MKSRRVIITIEAETDAPMVYLRRMDLWCLGRDGLKRHLDFDRSKPSHIVQVQVNAIKPERKAKRAKGAK